MEAEQATEVVEQEAPVEEQVIEPAAEAEAAPVADNDQEPVAETEAPYVPDLSTVDGIREAAERFPQLKGWREEGFNAGRLKREKELRQEQGSTERAKAYQDHLAQKYGIDLDQDDQKALPLFAKANADYLRAQMSKEWAEAALESFNVEDREIIQSVIDDENTDPSTLFDLAGQVWQAASQKVRSSAVADLSLQDVPEGSKLHADVQAHIQAEVEKELKAREEESRETPENPPRTPAGTPAGNSNLADMSPDERASYVSSLSDEELATTWSNALSGT